MLLRERNAYWEKDVELSLASMSTNCFMMEILSDEGSLFHADSSCSPGASSMIMYSDSTEFEASVL